MLQVFFLTINVRITWSKWNSLQKLKHINNIYIYIWILLNTFLTESISTEPKNIENDKFLFLTNSIQCCTKILRCLQNNSIIKNLKRPLAQMSHKTWFSWCALQDIYAILCRNVHGLQPCNYDQFVTRSYKS